MHIGIKFHGFHNGPTVECVSMTDFLSAGASIFVSLKVIFTHLLSPLVGAQVCVSANVCVSLQVHTRRAARARASARAWVLIPLLESLRDAQSVSQPKAQLT